MHIRNDGQRSLDSGLNEISLLEMFAKDTIPNYNETI